MGPIFYWYFYYIVKAIPMAELIPMVEPIPTRKSRIFRRYCGPETLMLYSRNSAEIRPFRAQIAAQTRNSPVETRKMSAVETLETRRLRANSGAIAGVKNFVSGLQPVSC